MASSKFHAETSALEWIAAAIGAGLLLLVLGVIGREAWRGRDTVPPAISLEIKRVIPQADSYLVEFEAVNSSNGTAATVQIEGEVVGPHGQRETAGVTLDYVAGHARAAGGLYFHHDPRDGSLRLRALGYQEP